MKDKDMEWLNGACFPCHPERNEAGAQSKDLAPRYPGATALRRTKKLRVDFILGGRLVPLGEVLRLRSCLAPLRMTKILRRVCFDKG